MKVNSENGNIREFYALQLMILLRVINKFEIEFAGMASFGKEKKSITVAFLTFSVGFGLKFSFNIFLLFSGKID